MSTGHPVLAKDARTGQLHLQGGVMADEIINPDVNATPVRGREEPAGDFQTFVDELQWTPALRRAVDPARAASVVLCQLERRLTGDTRDELMTHLPAGLQRLIDGCQRTDGSGSQRTNARTFLGDVADLLGVEPTSGEQIVTAVFTALRDRLPDDDIHWVASQLPPDLANLWRRPI
jgi:uncharacterized protein (DUF2267 family)